MNLLDCFRIQHSIFLEQLSFLEGLKDLKKSTATSGLKEVVFAIAKVVERHAAIEEKYLFPDLRPYAKNELEGKKVIEFEHGEIRRILKHLKKTSDIHKIRVEAAKFIAFLRDHIAKEEIVLFPLAEEKLGENRLEELGVTSGILNKKLRWKKL